MNKITFQNNGQPAINDTNLNKMQDNIEKGIEEARLKTQVYEATFNNVGNSSENGVNIDFSTMFPKLNLSDVVCFNVEITNVYETWDRTYANILLTTGTLQIRSYTATQQVAVRVTAFYR